MKLLFLTFICNTLHTKKSTISFNFLKLANFIFVRKLCNLYCQRFFCRLIDDRLITLYLEIVIDMSYLLCFFLIKAICRRCDEFICRQVADEQTPAEGAGASTVSTPKEHQVVQIPEQQTMVSFKYELMISISLVFLKRKESFLEEHRNWKKIEEEKTHEKALQTNTVVNLVQGSFVDQ